MPLTHKVISTVNATSGSISTIDIQSIPATYDDLILYVSARSTGNYGTGTMAMNWSFNGTTSNRSGQRFYASVSIGSDAPAGIHGIVPGVASTTQGGFGMSKMYIADYASSNRKVSIIESFAPGGSGHYEMDYMGGSWDNSTAINRITLTMSSDSFTQYTTATLVGVKKS